MTRVKRTIKRTSDHNIIISIAIPVNTNGGIDAALQTARDWCLLEQSDRMYSLNWVREYSSSMDFKKAKFTVITADPQPPAQKAVKRKTRS